MSRTVTALLNNRPEAEAVRASLASQVKVESTRILDRATFVAVDDLKLDREHAKSYRKALLDGGYLLVAKIARGEEPNLIIELIERAAGSGSVADEAVQSYQVQPEQDPSATPETEDVVVVEDATISEAVPPTTPTADHEGAVAPVAEPTLAAAPIAEPAAPMAEARERVVRDAPQEEPVFSEVHEELRIGEPMVAGGGARMRSVTREETAEEQVALKEERVGVENRPAERRLTDAEVEAGGLLKDRVFEIVEMREEPVVTKETVVREEVIIRKARHERTETIRDTVRHTEIEIEELPSS